MFDKQKKSIDNLKVLLINPPYLNFNGIKDAFGHGVPLNLLYLASYAQKMFPGIKVEVCDAEIKGLGYEQIRDILIEKQPDIIGITCPTPVMGHVIKIAELAKNILNKPLVIVGGPHPSAVPVETAKIPNIDVVVIGEGEQTFCELITHYIDNNFDFSDIDGVAFVIGKKVIITKPREYIVNLDTIPFPNRDLIDYKKYSSAPTKKVTNASYSTAILSSRGCYNNCLYCVSKTVWGQKIRLRNPLNVVDEIEYCYKKYRLKEFNFYDDLLLLNPDRIKKICEEITKRGLTIGWICFSRADTVPSIEVLKLMKKAGCKKISLGLESGSQKILDIMRKNITLQQSIEAVKRISKAGLNVHASFMLGIIGETEKTARETINFSKSLPLDNATFFITCPFPGTDLYKIAKEKGFINEKISWEDYSPITDRPPILCQNTLSSQRLVELQRIAFKEFYFRPKYMLRKILQIRGINDLKFVAIGFSILRGIMKKRSVEEG